MTTLEERILDLVDEVEDPCSVSQGIPTGLRRMGLVRRLDLVPAADGRVDVDLLMRLTGPGCLYVVHFERELRSRIEALPEVASFALAWDSEFDWSPEDIDAGVRAQLRERRDRILAEARGNL